MANKKLVEVEVEGAPVEQAVEVEEKNDGVDIVPGKVYRRAKIIIDEQDNYETKEVFIGVNGKAWKIMRRKEIWVPWQVYHVLDNAIETKYFRDEATGEMLEREVRRFPVRLLKVE